MVAQTEDQIDDIRQAIAALEAQREILGDAVVDASVKALNKELAALRQETVTGTQQRKLATILFTDIVGHTRLVQDLDPEENMAIIEEALLRLAQVVESHGGHIARYQGDGFKAVFGLPLAHEADPQNAVRAGLGIIDAANEYAQQLEVERSLAGFNVRVGIDTGLIIAGGATEAEDSISGLVVNLAARLESAAPPGCVLISQHTYQHVRGLFEVEAEEPIKAKGFPNLVPVYLVAAEKKHIFHRGMRGVEGVATRMVGRQEELKLLQDAFARAVQQNRAVFITIIGEAGVGKSRLLFEFEKWLEQQPLAVQQFTSRAAPEMKSSAQYLFREMLAAKFRILDSDPLETVQQKFVTGLLAGLPEDDLSKAHILGSWLGYDFTGSQYLAPVLDDAQQLKRRATLVLSEFFASTAADDPVAVLIEDVHWADWGSLNTAVALANKGQHLPLLIVCLARPSLLERLPDWGKDIADHLQITLQPLSAGETDTLVKEILRLVDSPQPELFEKVSERAEGNPFYAEELIKMMIDQGSIVTGAGSWTVDPQMIEAIDIPPTLTGVLQARLDRLNPSEKKALQQASVIGRVFWDRALQALSSEGTLALPILQTKEFIYARANSAFTQTMEYIFKHALLRDVTYETVLLRLRKDYHERIARWIEENAADRSDEFAGLIATHYTKAGIKNKASRHWEKAGDAADMSSDFFGASEAYKQALELISAGETFRLADLEAKLANVLGLVGQKRESVNLYRQALSHFEEPPAAHLYQKWQRTRLQLLLGLTSALYWSMQRDELAALMTETKQLLDKVGTSEQVANFYWRQSQLIFLQNNYRANEESLNYARKALAYAEKTGIAHKIAANQFFVGFNLLWAGKLDESVDLFNEGWQSSREINDTFRELQCLLYRSISLRMQRQVALAAGSQPELIELAHKIGLADYVAVVQANSAWVHYQRGRWQEALVESKLAAKTWEETGYPFTWLGYWVIVASALKAQQLDDAITGAHLLLDSMERPPKEIIALLETAVSAWDKKDEDLMRNSLAEAVQLAEQERYL